MGPPTTRKRSTANLTPVAQNFRPFVEKGRWAAKGTLPLPEPDSIPEALTKVVMHLCRKVLFLRPRIRLTVYAVLLFFISLLADYMPFPKTYFSYKDNFLNVYFVKFSWAWTFVLSGMFMYLTSSTYCCGKREKIVRHLLRLIVGTAVWFIWTSVFVWIEDSTGQCVGKEGGLLGAKGKRACFAKSGKWSSFDISGHSFLLIWCVFFMAEEAKAIIGWDGIKDIIRNEEYYRGKIGQPGPSGEQPPTETILRDLSDEDFVELKIRYGAYDLPAKFVLILMTGLCLIWDLMILMTAVYFHVMVEKVLGGLVAAFTWFVVYKGLYNWTSYFGKPGQGLFKYGGEVSSGRASQSQQGRVQQQQQASSGASKSKTSSSSTPAKPRTREDDVPKFMGMPLTALKNAKKEEIAAGGESSVS